LPNTRAARQGQKNLLTAQANSEGAVSTANRFGRGQADRAGGDGAARALRLQGCILLAVLTVEGKGKLTVVK
jgi:hypothetical protein